VGLFRHRDRLARLALLVFQWDYTTVYAISFLFGVNALDWVSRPIATNTIRNKPVAVIGASTGGFGAVWAQGELRKVLGAMGARVVDGEVAVGHAMNRFDPQGELNNRNLDEQVREVVLELLAEAGATTPYRKAA
jgi:chromate reductase, NAD(P)H dehydrogenase (quinone)